MQDFVGRIAAFAPPAWEQLPDLGLYMDQVITYLEKQYQPLYGHKKRLITPAMINNYVKCGLVARPVGKKYERAQIAQLMMLCMLKQAVSLEAMRPLVTPPEGGAVEDVYRAFLAQQQEALQTLASWTGASALRCAVLAAAHQLLCEEALRET